MIAGFINRILGFIMRVVLVRLIGDEGIGLFQMVFNIYLSLVILTTGGFPTAVSKLISEKIAHNKYLQAVRIFKNAAVLVICLSSIFALILFFSASFISSSILADQRTYYSLLAIAPAIIFCSAASIFRGFFQGLQIMTPSALSQIFEQVIRFISTIFLIYLTAGRGIEYTGAGIALGIGIGELAGFILLAVFMIRTVSTHFPKNINSKSATPVLITLKRLSQIAVPITAGQVFSSAMQSLEAIIIPARLQTAGYSIQESTSLFGHLSGMASPLILFPTVITVALTTSLVPAISKLKAQNNTAVIASRYLKVLWVIICMGIPSFVIFYRFGEAICGLVYGYPQAGLPLSILAFGTLPLYYLIASSGILYGLGKPMINLFNWFIGSSIKLVLMYYLTAEPQLGIAGASLSIVVQYYIIAYLNFRAIAHRIGMTVNVKKVIIKPLAAGMIMFFSIPYITEKIEILFGSTFQGLILNLLTAVLIYFATLILTGGVTIKDLKQFLNR